MRPGGRGAQQAAISMLRVSAGTVLSSLGAALLVLALVVIAGGNDPRLRMTADQARKAFWSTYLLWIRGLLEPGFGQSWSGQMMTRHLAPIIDSILLVAQVMVFCTLVTVIWVWLDGVARERSGEGSLELASTLFLAPTALWAALLTVALNLVVMFLHHMRPSWDPGLWYFSPNSHYMVRMCAATLALSFGSGTIWDLRSMMKSELTQLVERDFILVARANGLAVAPRLVRNLAKPFATRLVGKLPLLLGEAIVAEFIFHLDGIGHELDKLLKLGDGYAIMTITAALVLITMGVRGLVQIAGLWVTPPLKDEAA